MAKNTTTIKFDESGFAELRASLGELTKLVNTEVAELVSKAEELGNLPTSEQFENLSNRLGDLEKASPGESVDLKPVLAQFKGLNSRIKELETAYTELKKQLKNVGQPRKSSPLDERTVAIKFERDHATATHDYRGGKTYDVPHKIAKDLVDQGVAAAVK